jgi:capsular exopolysaccharide synthesis family protein
MTIDLICITDPASPAAEAYRRLRVNLTSPTQGVPLEALLVVAAGPEPDKASVVANLAVTFARVGKKVILVDGDLRQPAQHAIFGLSNDRGITTVVGKSVSELPLQETGIEGLCLLSSGPPVELPSELLASPATADLVARLRQDAEVVLFDAPPVIVATDAAELAGAVDGVLLVVAAGRTKRDHAEQALQLLNRVGARVVGATFINAPASAGMAASAVA